MDNKHSYRNALLLCAAFFLYTLLVKTVDCAPIGPANTVVGFSHLNGAVHRLVGVHSFWYEATEFLGLAAFFPALMFAFLGLYQLLNRKSLCRVDAVLYLLAGLYVMTAVCYFFFEVVVINRRPVLMPGELLPEASYPSSHTLLSCVIPGSAIMVLPQYLKKRNTCNALQVLLGIVLAVLVIGRLLSGVHWLTDILGGILLSLCLLETFRAVRASVC